MSEEPIEGAALAVLSRVAKGESLRSTPDKWWNWMNPFVVRFESEQEPLADAVCDYLKSKRLLKRGKYPYLILAKRGELMLALADKDS